MKFLLYPVRSGHVTFIFFLFLTKKTGGGGRESCILSSSYPWRRWENVFQINGDVAKDCISWVLSPYQEPLIPPGVHCLSIHKAGCMYMKVKEDGQSEAIFLEVKQEYKIKVPAVPPFTRGSRSSHSA